MTAQGHWTTDEGLAAARTAWRNVLCGGKNGRVVRARMVRLPTNWVGT
ncbi:MAG: hypothetical protein LKJ54_09325 [Acetobacter peroxydans]|nr:hypothetical protein [Acetobacter peroxydans]MCI2079182.1 hypothetical protein [Acetobacter peroxydans]